MAGRKKKLSKALKAAYGKKYMETRARTEDGLLKELVEKRKFLVFKNFQGVQYFCLKSYISAYSKSAIIEKVIGFYYKTVEEDLAVFDIDKYFTQEEVNVMEYFLKYKFFRFGWLLQFPDGFLGFLTYYDVKYYVQKYGSRFIPRKYIVNYIVHFADDPRYINMMDSNVDDPMEQMERTKNTVMDDRKKNLAMANKIKEHYEKEIALLKEKVEWGIK